MMKKRRKRCYTCRKLKLFSQFPPSSRHRDGLYPYCHECHADYEKDRYPNRAEVDKKNKDRFSLKSQGLKRCTRCRQTFPFTEFYEDSRHSDHKQSRCRRCFCFRASGSRLKREYGLTLEELQTIFDFQEGKCAICRRVPKKYRFNIDHSHESHILRGAICVNCNTNLLPYVEYRPEWVMRAFDYLKNPPASKVLGERLVPETNQSRQPSRVHRIGGYIRGAKL